MCGLFGKVDSARRKVEGAVLAIDRGHWKWSLVLEVRSKVAMTAYVVREGLQAE